MIGHGPFWWGVLAGWGVAMPVTFVGAALAAARRQWERDQ